MKRADVSVNQRLLLGFGMLLVLLALELALAFHWFDRVGELRRRVTDDIDPRARASSRLERSILYRALSIRNYGLTRDPVYLVAQTAALEEVQASLRELDALAYLPKGRAIVDEMKPAARSYLAAAEGFIALLQDGADIPRVEAAEGDLSRARERLFELSRRFSDFQQWRVADASATIAQVQRTMTWGLPLLALLMIATIAATGLVVSRAVGNPVRELTLAARALSAGDYAPALALVPSAADLTQPVPRSRSELRELASVVARAAATLQRREARLAADLRLSGALGSSLAVGQLVDAALREIVSHACAELGAVYVVDPQSSTLQPVASFAFGDGLTRVMIGDGIPGQAAAQKTSIHVRDIPVDAPFRIRLGFEQVAPRAVLAVPAVLQGETIAVILLASVRGFSEDDVRFVEHGAAVLGTRLQNALAHDELRRIGAELREKNEQLNARAEELQALGERVQAQNEELQAQHEEIHAQNEEMQAQNEEMRAQRDELHATGERLRDVARALEEADGRKDEFLATLGHELRNPLAAITNAVHLLEAGHARRGDGLDALQVIARQTRQLARLTSDLLDVSRISRGKLTLQTSRVDLGEILRQAAESSHALIEKRRHELSLRVGAGPLVLDGDPARLEQIVCNLLHNAAKFTDPGGQITAAVEAEQGHVVLRVKDSGVGIEPELLPHVFDLFTQGKAAHHDGLGLGLSLVRSLVEMHGGQVEAASRGARQGAEFVVRLPRAAGEREGCSTAPGYRAPASTRSLRVLVVDDNPDVADSVAMLVEELGHRAEVERDGAAGLENATRSVPDVVLLDIGLPDRSGYDVARDIRSRLGPFSRTRLVALTGHGREEDRQRAMDAGFDLYFVKPLAAEDLRDVLTRIANSCSETELA